jgi:hypothetical protein
MIQEQAACLLEGNKQRIKMDNNVVTTQLKDDAIIQRGEGMMCRSKMKEWHL